MSAGPFLFLLLLIFFFFGLVFFCYCQAHFLQHLLVPFCPSLQVFATSTWPVHATSSKPQTQNPSFLTCTGSMSPSAYLSPQACMCLAWPAPHVSMFVCLSVSSGEAFSLWWLSSSSLRAMNTCGLCYQYFNFYQYGIWLMMIHDFRPSIQ